MEHHESRSLPRILLTGDRGIGKSTVCEETVGLLKARGLRCGGILTTKILSERGAIVGIRIKDILSAPPRECLLARTDQDLGGPATGRYWFSPEGVQFGNAALERAAAEADVIFADELGHLELRGEGFTNIFSLLQSARTPAMVVVAQNEFVSQVQERVRSRDLALLEVTLSNRGHLAQRLVELLLCCCIQSSDLSQSVIGEK